MANLSRPVRIPQRTRLALYAAAGVAGVLALAYFDGGEEPIRPMVEPAVIAGLAAENG